LAEDDETLSLIKRPLMLAASDARHHLHVLVHEGSDALGGHVEAPELDVDTSGYPGS
jgi:hypothetical protein